MTHQHFLSFVTNFKNEQAYLKEWLDYHIQVGVNHFYLFNQDGSEESRKILAPYEEAGYVTQHIWTHFGDKYEGPTYFFQKDRNHLGNIHAVQKHRHESVWMLKIDVDEFLFSKNPDKSIHDIIKEYNPGIINRIRIPRIDFGSSGLLSPTVDGILKPFVFREANSSNYKDCASTQFLSSNSRCFSQHYWAYTWFNRGHAITFGDEDELRINHYYSKSKQEYFERQNISRGRKISEEDFKKIELRCNQIEDNSMHRHLPLRSMI